MEIDKNIDVIIHSYLEGTANQDELLTLLNWIKLRQENVTYFNQLCSIWENSSNITNTGNETELALNRLNERLRLFTEKETDVPELEVTKRFLFIRAAAIALVLLGISAFFYFALKTNKDVPAFITAIAPNSQKSQLILADGTKVWLNSGTTLKYQSDYGRENRQIYLDGEAYFEVAKNPDKPFLVYASNIIVRAIGTSFNVKCYAEDNTIETTLIEGKVQVSKKDENTPDDIVFLMPNQRAVYNRFDKKLVIAGNQEIKTEKVDEKVEDIDYLQPRSIESVISWRNEELIFENEPFEELTKRLERWYNIDIKVLDPEINLKNRYTGKFVNNESLEQVLRIISRTTPIEYKIQNKDEVIIETKK